MVKNAIKIKKLKNKIDITVALPTWENKDIIWLQLESLCRQETQYTWELIVCEEQTPNMMGKETLFSYYPRLKKAGCVDIKYITLQDWVPLSQKWVLISEAALGNSFILAASDNYSPPNRLEISHQKILEGNNWVDVKKGLFYNVNTGDTSTYKLPSNGSSKTGLFMCTKTEYIKKLKGPWPSKHIDNWIRKQITIEPRFQFENQQKGLHTDGANKISQDRKICYSNLNNFYHTPVGFYPPEQSLAEILPDEIITLLNKLK
mgnify:FL=1|tara:strand:+ start:487 stop:1269 length:783 start_codon:yes stop_codon:yes gene_type:complete